MGKRVLRKHGYPPDKQKKATQTVLEQAQPLAPDCTPYGIFFNGGARDMEPG